MRRQALLCAALVAAAACCCSPARSQPIDYGVNVNRLFNDALAPDRLDRQLTAVAASGITEARTDAMWAFVEPWGANNGRIGPLFDETDRRALALARHALRWLPVLDYTPAWQQTVTGDAHSAPIDPAAFARYAALIAARYGRGGTFWRAHPELRYLPVRTYELWNEENVARFWSPRPQPDRYADLYLQARAAIKKIDPRAVVAVGGLGHGAAEFVKGMFAARPRLEGHMDAVAVHPYAPTVEGVVRTIARLTQALRALDTRTVPLMVTEVGWESANATRDVLALPEGRRAANMARVVSAIGALQRRDRILALMAYTWWTPRQDPTDGEDWYGLARDDATLTPAGLAYVHALRDLASRSRRPAVPRPPAASASGSAGGARCRSAGTACAGAT
jgi:polysaccharide biosynthesis protein PslG